MDGQNDYHEKLKDENVKKITYLKRMENRQQEPFEESFNKVKKELYLSCIANKLERILPDEWTYYSAMAYLQTFCNNIPDVLYPNIIEWLMDEPLSDIEYKGWTMNSLMEARKDIKTHCLFVKILSIFSAYNKYGNNVNVEFPLYWILI